MTSPLPPAPAWMNEALCAQIGTDDWYPETGVTPHAAKRVCNGDGVREPCPVRAECLDYALEMDDRFGVYGGMTPRERRKLIRPRAPRLPVLHREPRRMVTAETKARIAELTREGKSIRDIARQLDVSETTVSRVRVQMRGAA